MAQNPFKKAERKDIPLRVLLVGLSGSGKTYTALALAAHMGTKVAVADAENDSARKYANELCRCSSCRGHGLRFDFDVVNLNNHSPKSYMDTMRAASVHGYGVLVLDGISPEWDGKGGCLEMVDASRAKNKYTAWGPVTQAHQSFLQTIRDWPGHVIATCRAKEKHETSGGDVTSRGILPIQREGIEYEFDVVVFLNGGNGSVIKTRAADLDGWLGEHPGGDLADRLLAWSAGLDEPAPRVEWDRERVAELEAEVARLGEQIGQQDLAARRVREAKGDLLALEALRDKLAALVAEAAAQSEEGAGPADEAEQPEAAAEPSGGAQ